MVFSSRSAGRHAGTAACFFTFAALCFAQTPGAAPKSAPTPQPLLPSTFSGWVEAGAATTGTLPAMVDQPNADVLNEYGLKDFAENAYRHGNSQVKIRAMRFGDATGAYGAFTFYRKPDMKPEVIGRGGAGDSQQILFWVGVTVVDATFEHPAADAESALKALAAKLPPAGGSDAVPPSLPDYLPPNFLDRSTLHYAIGPAAYARGGGVLPAGVIDFSRDAEAVTAQYSTREGRGTLTLIGYPTPQMAIKGEKDLNALLKGSLPAILKSSSAPALGVHRSGPIVAVTSGDFSGAEAHALLSQVRYRAEVTLNRNTNPGVEVKHAAKMLLGIAYLTAIIVAIAVLLGILLGGGRALWRVTHGKPISTVYEEEFISLNLSDGQRGSIQKLP
jgi:hypothetical protein